MRTVRLVDPGCGGIPLLLGLLTRLMRREFRATRGSPASRPTSRPTTASCWSSANSSASACNDRRPIAWSRPARSSAARPDRPPSDFRFIATRDSRVVQHLELLFKDLDINAPGLPLDKNTVNAPPFGPSGPRNSAIFAR